MELRERLETLANNSEKYITELTELAHEIIDTEAKINSLKIDLKALKKSVSEGDSSSDNSKINEELAALTSKISTLKIEFKEKRNSYKTDIKGQYTELLSSGEDKATITRVMKITLGRMNITRGENPIISFFKKNFTKSKKEEIAYTEHYEEILEKRQSKLNELRLEGENKVENLKNENLNISKNKMIDKITKEKLINSNKAEIKKAKITQALNSYELTEEVVDLITFISINSSERYKVKKEENKQIFRELKLKLTEDVEKEKTAFEGKLAAEQQAFEAAHASTPATKEELKEHRINIADIKFAHKQNLNDLKSLCEEKKSKLKDDAYNIKNEEFAALEKANNRKLPSKFIFDQKYSNYASTFSLKNFILKNGLYIAIVFLFIIAIIYYGVDTGRFLLDGSTILLIFNQVAPKIFLALGVAGLIVLAGTDLSIGRLVGLAAVLCGMFIVPDGKTSVQFFENPVTFFQGWPLGIRVLFGFVLAIFACTLISTIAGFFTAKFKMHAFISTLSTQLITFGLFAGITKNTFTGNPDPNVSKFVSDYIPGTEFSPMIIYAIVGIAIMWFIWNKTKFGKNMFAVGGNAEAASVSGINVFWVTLGVFMLAGVYYGVGGSLYGIYTGNVRAQTGQGMEADAIAACVVGGVSFSGGIGKISGVVIGAILFQAITVVLPFIGITNANYQLAIKGLIILSAVALDCAKYLKKK